MWFDIFIDLSNIIVGLSFLSYIFIKNVDNIIINFGFYFILMIFSKYLFLYIFDFINNITKPKILYFNELDRHLIIYSFVNSLSYLTAKKYVIINQNLTIINCLFSLIKFYPLFFIFEIIFDFLFYWTHRLIHSNRNLYQIIHKKHHKHNDLIPIMSFYMSPLEMILLNEIPTIISLFMIKYLFDITLFDYFMIKYFRIIGEMMEHLGNYNYKESKYSYIYLYKKIFEYLKINILSKDHELHHKLLSINFSKRMILFDKIFNTYKKNKI
jgi:sterol desaturase/sphingolipid hydroxylase (fatty acid hydroxylase superfamily)